MRRRRRHGGALFIVSLFLSASAVAARSEAAARERGGFGGGASLPARPPLFSRARGGGEDNGGVGSSSSSSASLAVDGTRKKRKKRKRRSPPSSSSVVSSSSSGHRNKMPSIFASSFPASEKYDRYAACLAATEGLRRHPVALSDDDGGRFRRWTDRLLDFVVARKKDDEEEERGQSSSLLSGRVIRALGLTPSEFDSIGKEVRNDEELKRKVSEQAYLYRMAATVDMDKIPVARTTMTTVIGDDDAPPPPPSEPSPPRSSRRPHRRENDDDDLVGSYVRSIREIEHLRLRFRRQLASELRVGDDLPKGWNFSDPSIRPMLSSEVRDAIDAFATESEDVVRRNGLSSEEFNRLTVESRNNRIFRWRVNRRAAREGKK